MRFLRSLFGSGEARSSGNTVTFRVRSRVDEITAVVQLTLDETADRSSITTIQSIAQGLLMKHCGVMAMSRYAGRSSVRDMEIARDRIEEVLRETCPPGVAVVSVVFQ